MQVLPTTSVKLGQPWSTPVDLGQVRSNAAGAVNLKRHMPHHPACGTAPVGGSAYPRLCSEPQLATLKEPDRRTKAACVAGWLCSCRAVPHLGCLRGLQCFVATLVSLVLAAPLDQAPLGPHLTGKRGAWKPGRHSLNI